MSNLPRAVEGLAFDKLTFELLYEEKTGKRIELDTLQWLSVLTHIDSKVDTFLDGAIREEISILRDKEDQ
jgi:hypothetical protein